MDISSLCRTHLHIRKAGIFFAAMLITGLLAGNTASASPSTFIHARASDSKQGALVKVAALAKNGFKRPISTKSSASDDDNYLIERPDEEGDNYIHVVLQAMMKNVDPGGNRNELIFKLGNATPGQKALYAVYLMQNEVMLGGFKSYFKSNAANLVYEARKGLKLIGAYKYLNLLEDALVLFADDEEMLETAFDRKNFLDTVPEKTKYKVFEKVDSRFESLENDNLLKDSMVAYINKHPSQFFRK